MGEEGAVEEVVEVAEAEETPTKTRVRNLLKIETKGPNIQTYLMEINSGARCIINTGKIHIFVQIPLCAHGKM